MESLGVNILNSEEFCSDLIALFFNHIWECDDCYSMTLGALALFFGLLFFLFILGNIFLGFFEKLFSKLFDRFRYKKLYDDLITKHGDLQEEYDELSDIFDKLAYEYTVLLDQHKELQEENYHTCN